MINSVISGIQSTAETSGDTLTLQDRAIVARDTILKGETPFTSEDYSFEVNGDSLKPTLPPGFIKNISDVKLDNVSLVEGVDYIFFPDRQRFYFLGGKSGALQIEGVSYDGGVRTDIVIAKSITNANNFETYTIVDAVGQGLFTYDVEGTPDSQTADTILHKGLQTVLFRSAFSGDAIIVYGLTTNGTITITQETFEADNLVLTAFWDTITDVLVNDVSVAYTELNGVITLTIPVADPSVLKIEGTMGTATLVYTEENFSGDTLTLPTEVESVSYASLTNVYDSGYTVSMFTLLVAGTVYFGYNFPYEYVLSTITIGGTKSGAVYTFIRGDYFGNFFAFPRQLEDVLSVKLDSVAQKVVFDQTNQKIYLTEDIEGTLTFTADFYPYQGLATGGETLRIVREIPGVMATTCGTGEHFCTLNSIGRNLQSDYAEYYDVNAVVVVDEDSTVIYEDYSENCQNNIHLGFTAEELKPLTVKLPFAKIWDGADRDDSALFSTAFTPDPSFPYFSATYTALDDSIRVSEATVSPDSVITLSESLAVRGLKGVEVNGPVPVFYGGSVGAGLVLNTYKWFIVEVTDTNENSNLLEGSKYLLCVSNTTYGERVVSNTLEVDTSTVSADLFSIEENI